MGADSPSWVPGEAELGVRERLEEGVTGLYGDLPPGVGPLLEVSAQCVARAFQAYARGQLDLCDAILAEGLGAAGEIFTGMVEGVTSSPAWLSRVDSPDWVPFLVHMAFMVLDPEPEPVRQQAPPAAPVNLAADMRAMGLM
jgi:hypothetical protein